MYSNDASLNYISTKVELIKDKSGSPRSLIAEIGGDIEFTNFEFGGTNILARLLAKSSFERL